VQIKHKKPYNYDIIKKVIQMKIYNTLTKKVEEFVPNNKGQVNMYTCGPTVYFYAHIGNLRTYISEDILEKGLNYIGYKVKRCMNITDVGHYLVIVILVKIKWLPVLISNINLY
jgi:arginyl-tRNA synthetase